MSAATKSPRTADARLLPLINSGARAGTAVPCTVILPQRTIGTPTSSRLGTIHPLSSLFSAKHGLSRAEGARHNQPGMVLPHAAVAQVFLSVAGGPTILPEGSIQVAQAAEFAPRKALLGAAWPIDTSSP